MNVSSVDITLNDEAAVVDAIVDTSVVDVLYKLMIQTLRGDLIIIKVRGTRS